MHTASWHCWLTITGWSLSGYEPHRHEASNPLALIVQQTLSRNTLTLLLSNAGSAVLSFVLSVLIGRALGKDGLGVYATALAWVFPLSLVAEFGLGTLLTREAARDPAAEHEYLRLATTMRLWLGGGLMIALMIVAPLLSSDISVIRGLQISAPLILINPLFGNFTALFRARQQMWPIPRLNVGMLVAQVSLTALVFVAGGDVLAALLVNTLTSAGQLAAAWWVWRRWFTSPPAPLSVYREGEGQANALPLQITALLKHAWPFAVAAVLAAIQMRLATIMLERMTDAGSVGYFAAATRFAEAGRALPNALFGALFPALAAMTVQPESLMRTFRKVMLGLGGYGSILGLMFSLLSPLILQITYGADFGAAETTLQVVMWSLLPALLRAGVTLYWYALGREGPVNSVTLVMIVIQAGLSMVMIPAEGVVGAAVAVFISEVAGLVLLSIPLWRQRFYRDAASQP